jgi:hypothetical protein
MTTSAPVRTEAEFARQRALAEFRCAAKYPLRLDVELTPEELRLKRDQLGLRAPFRRPVR